MRFTVLTPSARNCPAFTYGTADGRGRKRQCNVSGKQIDHRGRRAFVRYMHDADTGHGLEQFGREVRLAPAARRTVKQFTGMFLCKRNELPDRFHRHRVVHDQYLRGRYQHRNRREVPDRIVGELAIQTRIDGVRGRKDQQRVTIRRRLGDILGADIGARPRAVVDDDLLPPFLGQLLPQSAREYVRRAAGRERIGLDGPGRGRVLNRGPQQPAKPQCQSTMALLVFFLLVFFLRNWRAFRLL